jgi:hypothetical protein
MSVPKDGQPTGVKGRITKESIAAGLGLGGPDSLKEPEAGDGRPMESPAQARARVEGKPVPPDPPGFARTVVKGGRDAWEYLGRPATSPIGSAPEGMPIEPEPMSREDEAKLREQRGEVPQRTDWDKIDKQRAARTLAEKMGDLRARMERLLEKEAGVTR